MAKKHNCAYIYSKHAQDQYYGFNFQSLALDLMINDYYHFIIGQMINFYYKSQAFLFS